MIKNINNYNLTFLINLQDKKTITANIILKNYPFSAPKVHIDGKNYINEIANMSDHLHFIGKEGCLCCDSITCPNVWCPLHSISTLLHEIRSNYINIDRMKKHL